MPTPDAGVRWKKLFELETSSLITPAPDGTAWKRFFELFTAQLLAPAEVKASPAAVPAAPASDSPTLQQKAAPPAESKPRMAALSPPAQTTSPPTAQPATSSLPPPRSPVVSLRQVNFQRELSGHFFRSLKWCRHDPTLPDSPHHQLVESADQSAPARITARRLMAYEIPWDARGGKPSGPLKTDTMRSVPAAHSLPGLAELATHQALATAKALRLRQGAAPDYSSPSGPTITAFLADLPWQNRRPAQQPENLTLPS